MIGFLIGTACLMGLIATVKRARWAHGYGSPYGCHAFGHAHGRGPAGWQRDDGYGSDDPFAAGPAWGWGGRWGRSGGGRDRGARFGGFSRGGPWMMRRLFEALDTTPGQEKVLREAFEQMWGKGKEAKEAVREARKGLASTMREESFDAETLGSATARLEEATETMRKALIDAFATVHGVLEPQQRKILADLVESGPSFRHARGGFGGPYREGPQAPWEV